MTLKQGSFGNNTRKIFISHGSNIRKIFWQLASYKAKVASNITKK